MLPCGVWHATVWNTRPWFFTALKVAGLVAPVAALRWCELSAICDLLLTLCCFGVRDPFCLFFIFFLSSKDPIHLWGQELLGAGGFPLWEGQRFANASPEQLLLAIVYAATFVLCRVSKCHDSWFCKLVIRWSCVPQSLLVAMPCFFSGECFVLLCSLTFGSLQMNVCCCVKAGFEVCFPFLQVLFFLCCVPLIFMELLWKEV